MPEDFDVFLSHNSQDKPAVREIGEALKGRGLTVWLDEWELRPGQRWQKALESAIETSRGVAVFVGESGLGPWEEPEMEVFLNRAVRETGMPVIPVLLPGAPKGIQLPRFLSLYTWVDLRDGITEKGLMKLEWGITGVKPDGKPALDPPPPAAPPAEEKPRKGWRLFREGRLTGFAGMLVFSVLALGVGLALLRPSSNSGQVDLPSKSLDLYALRVQVVDPEGNAVPSSTVHVSAGNEPQRLQNGWWEVEIPAAKLPLHGEIAVRVESDRWKGAETTLTLGQDPNPSVKVQLGAPESWLRGQVLDPRGNPIAGAVVSIQGGTAAATTSDSNGNFELLLALPRETSVQIRAQRDGYAPDSNFCYTGRDRCSIELMQP